LIKFLLIKVPDCGSMALLDLSVQDERHARMQASRAERVNKWSN